MDGASSVMTDAPEPLSNALGQMSSDRSRATGAGRLTVESPPHPGAQWELRREETDVIDPELALSSAVNGLWVNLVMVSAWHLVL